MLIQTHATHIETLLWYRGIPGVSERECVVVLLIACPTKRPVMQHTVGCRRCGGGQALALFSDRRECRLAP